MGHGEHDMKLPDGKTCNNCGHFPRCSKLVGAQKENASCDFSPSRYQERWYIGEAAPDMLAALKAILTPPIASREAIFMAEKAIKKAEGKDG